MARRKRKYIPLVERLASALSALLPQEIRDDLRARKVPAKEVMRLFVPDHISLHCFGGSHVDKWWNLDMRLCGPELKAKDRADTSRAAKVKRIEDKWDRFLRNLARRPNKWKRCAPKIPSRPFQPRGKKAASRVPE